VSDLLHKEAHASTPFGLHSSLGQVEKSPVPADVLTIMSSTPLLCHRRVDRNITFLAKPAQHSQGHILWRCSSPVSPGLGACDPSAVSAARAASPALFLDVRPTAGDSGAGGISRRKLAQQGCGVSSMSVPSS
jgi:hypothetical protein